MFATCQAILGAPRPQKQPVTGARFRTRARRGVIPVAFSPFPYQRYRREFDLAQTARIALAR